MIDLFGDQDVADNSLSYHVLGSFTDSRNIATLLRIIKDYARNYDCLRIVTGSGFENNPDLLAYLQQQYSVLGNDANVVRQIKNPNVFFKKLNEVSLPYPGSRINPDADNIILLKEIGATGGQHIRIYDNKMAVPKNAYLQTLLPGESYSATFVADAESFYLLGFNQTWIRSKGHNFSFAGAISGVQFPEKLHHKINQAIQHLVQQFKLRGLCGMDFIVQGEEHYFILEINPRLTATFEFYDHQQSLLIQHLATLNGKLINDELNKIDHRSAHHIHRGLAILYADRDIIMPDLCWPHWVTDRPYPGTKIAVDMPVCTVHAEGTSVQDVRYQLMVKLKHQQEQLYRILTVV